MNAATSIKKGETQAARISVFQIQGGVFMDLLNKISIKNRMMFSFALALVFFILFAVFSIIEMNKLGELTATMYLHPLQVSNAALKAEAGVVSMHSSMKDESMSRNDMELHQAIVAVQTEEKIIPVLILTAKDLMSEDLKKLADNNVQHLVQKGDVPRKILLHKIRLMLGETSWIGSQENAASQEMPSRPPLKIPQAEGKPTILVVEDNPDNMITMKAILHSQYNLIEATDGEQGLNMALAERPDLILLDMSLPKMDGFTVVREIKGDPKGRHIPVIALTAHAMKGSREKAIEAGCDDYISKPVEPEGVLQKIKDWLEK